MAPSLTGTDPASPTPPRSGLSPVWIAAAVYLLAALWMLYPIWLDPLHGVVGDWRHPDMISNHWLYRWVADRLLAGAGLLHNDRYYLPVGDAPWLAGNGSDAIPAAILAAVLPWPLSVTAWCALTLVLNGLGGYALARAAGARVPGALVAGAVIVLSPYVAYELSGMRLAQAPLYWMAFFLAAWLRMLQHPTWRRAVAAGLLFGASAFVYWYYGLWMALLGAALFFSRPRWRALAVFVPTALCGTLPFLAVFLHHWAEIPGTVGDAFPHPLSVHASLPFFFPFWATDGVHPAQVLPLVLLALVGLGWWLSRPEPGPARRAWWVWLCGALIFGALCLGPLLCLPDGSASAVPGPYRFVYASLGVLRRFWWPYRHIAVVLLCLVPIAAAGLDGLEVRLARRLGRAAGPLLVGLAVAVLPFDQGLRGAPVGVHASWWQAPEGYRRLAELEGDAMIELPLTPAMARSQQTLSYQWIHRKKLVNGHAMWVERVRPDAWDAWVAENSLLAGLQAFERGEADGTIAVRPADVQALLDLGVRYLVVNSEYFPGDLIGLPPRYQQVFGLLFGAPALDYQGLVAWDLAAFKGVMSLPAPPWAPSEGDLSVDGTQMPEVGVVNSHGWMPLDRRFPPAWPDTGSRERALEELTPMLRNKLRRTDLGHGGVRQ